MKNCILSLLVGIFGTSLSRGAVVISELDLTNNKIELVNTGSTAVDFTGWHWCNLVNGSPAYGSVTSNSTIDSGLSSAGASLTNFGAGKILVLNIGDSWLRDTQGEVGLYRDASFGSSSSIEDYVSWGVNGVRDSVAAAAGIWTDNDPIDLTGIDAGDNTVQLTVGENGNSAASYQFAAGTLGATNVPEPTTGLLGLIGVGLLARRRRA